MSAAKTIADVLLDDMAFEKEFYMIPKDILRTMPRPNSAEQVTLDRWKEVGADGVVIGTVQKTTEGIVVELRLMRVVNGASCSARSTAARQVDDRWRPRFAHSIADEIHKQQPICGAWRGQASHSHRIAMASG